MNWNYEQYNSYLDAIKSSVNNIADVGYERIKDSFQWESDIDAVVDKDMAKFKVTKCELENQKNELYQIVLEDKLIPKKEKELAKNKYFDMRRKIESIDTLLKLPSILSISEFERQMITGKILAVTGDAGIGKSQMFANEANCLIKGNRNVLLLYKQFMQGLEVLAKKPIKEVQPKELL